MCILKLESKKPVCLSSLVRSCVKVAATVSKSQENGKKGTFYQKVTPMMDLL